MGSWVDIIEVGPRDGLQNEQEQVPLEAKVAFINALSASGLRAIEATSFVSPKAVPQLADADDVMRLIDRPAGVRFHALTPNERGYDRALAARVDTVALFTSATEAFCEANIRCSIDASFARFAPVVARAKADGIAVRGYLSVAFVCPFSGEVNAGDAAAVALRLAELGCDDICLADTIGRAQPEQITTLLSLLLESIPVERLSLHVHDTDGRALDNIDAALDLGIRRVDGAARGLGGCPFAPGAPGNAATERIVHHLHDRGFETGVDLTAIEAALAYVQPYLSRSAVI
jgi:isopropylmalate/homocitrate/citramalate synthase